MKTRLFQVPSRGRLQPHAQGGIVFLWNFIQFMVTPHIRGVLLWLTGFLDLVFAILLTIGCALAGSFLPGTLGGCSNASTWRNTPDGRNLFMELSGKGQDWPNSFTKGLSWKHQGFVAGMKEQARQGATSECQSLMSVWILTIVVM